jgi:dTDP-4-dehydrorhamnose 3,5-epimerase
MRFHELPLAGAQLIELDRHEDDRGFNARLWCADEFAEAGLMGRLAQANVIFNHAAGTLRGLHFQRPPYAEAKLFRVTRGAIHDVIVDLRPDSPTYLRWESLELRAGDHRMLYVPERFGQAFLTLEDATEVTYFVSTPYTPDAGDGIRYDDPALGIEWPGEVRVISEKDASWPPFDPASAGIEAAEAAR